MQPPLGSRITFTVVVSLNLFPNNEESETDFLDQVLCILPCHHVRPLSATFVNPTALMGALPPTSWMFIRLQVLLAITLEGRPAQSLLVLASARDSSSVQSRPELVVIPAGAGKGQLHYLRASIAVRRFSSVLARRL